MLKHAYHPHPTVRQPFTLRAWIEVESPYPIHVDSVLSDQLKLDSIEAKLDTEQQSTAIAQWDITPTERGLFEWGGVIISLRTPLGLLCSWQSSDSISLKVYPQLDK